MASTSLSAPVPGAIARSASLRVISAFLAISGTGGAAIAADTFRSAPPPAPAQASSSWFSGDWTITLGAQGRMQPEYEGADDSVFSPVPIISVRRAGTPLQFRAPDDGFGFGILDINGFRAGPVGRIRGERAEKDNQELRGLGDVDIALEAGLFAEYWPTQWLRIRGEVRRGVTGHDGFVGDLGADVVVQPVTGLVLSLGPRVAANDSEYAATYFGIDALQSARSGRPIYKAEAGVRSVGLMASASYKLTQQVTLTGFGRFDRLVGDAADAPLVKNGGSENQFTVGLGLSYSFDLSLGR